MGIDNRLDGRIPHRFDELSVRMRPNGPTDDQAIQNTDGKLFVMMIRRVASQGLRDSLDLTYSGDAGRISYSRP